MRNVSAQTAQLAAARGSVHPLMVVTLLLHLIPISWYFGGVYLTPLRLGYLFTVPVLVVIWARGGTGPRLLVDWLIIGFLAWTGVTMSLNDPSRAVTFTGFTSLFVLGGYLTARYTVRSAADFMALSRFLAGIVIFFLLPLGMYEALGRTEPLLSKLLAGISFIDTYKDADYCCRLGLDRAQSVFAHPIHHGVACALPFALYFMSTANHESFFKRSLIAALIVVATFTSVSSGAFLSIVLMGALIAYTLIFAKNPNQWKHFLWGATAAYIVLELNSTKFVFFTLSEKMSFNSWNVHVRGMIYDAGIAQVKLTPLFGAGFIRLPQLPHWLTGSVDNYWLQLAIIHGLPCFLILFAAFVYVIARAGRNGFTKGSDLYNVRLAYGFTLTALTFCMVTVSIWAEVQSLIFMTLGMGMFLFSAHEAQAQAPTEPAPQRAGPVYTRFPGGPAGGQVATARNQAPARARTMGAGRAPPGGGRRPSAPVGGPVPAR